jgi:UDP-N-acetylglucosamine 4-epimerase
MSNSLEFRGMNVLLTGGAGFIGSNLVSFFLKQPNVESVRVMDNLATGHMSNLEEFLHNSKFSFFEGDIRISADCEVAMENVDVVCHQAALGSVPRSIADPLTSHNVNVNGFINILEAARKSGVKRIVYASSSSVYGDLMESPKVETRVGKLLSPYAATKMTNELYAEAYAKNYGITLVGLRYFNVFGPKQDPNGAYAAVIPKFVSAALRNESPTINGDGSITRDFTPVSNVIQINWKGLTSDRLELGKHYVFNVACGQTTDLNAIWVMVRDISGSSAEATYGPNRKGDIFFSLADVSSAQTVLEYVPDADLQSALSAAVDYYRASLSDSPN